MTSRLAERLADVTRLFCEWLNEHSKCSVIYCAIFWESPLNIIFLSDRVHTQPPPSILIFASTGSAFNKYLVCYLSQLSDDALPCDSQIIHSRRRSQSMGLKINSAWAAEICTIFFLRNENSNCATNYFYVVFHLRLLKEADKIFIAGSNMYHSRTPRHFHCSRWSRKICVEFCASLYFFSSFFAILRKLSTVSWHLINANHDGTRFTFEINCRLLMFCCF